MRARVLVLTGLSLLGLGQVAGCGDDDDCEVRQTRVYQTGPVYQSGTYYQDDCDRPRVHVRNRFVDVRVGQRWGGWGRPVRVRVNRDWD